ncbi:MULTISPECIES: CCA tRNA nucleotidyltransferase [Paenibacillus]|uniref:[cytidine(C)-cytidine(C)-adenosine (A)]-adding enzyme n=1 Tax=Paenibacillus polymyxa TaxID=1406 RepID=A0ABX2Z7C9_PAEPO|nr:MULTISPECIES: CCA tRNA nucleotidyltransferase [Paenibacillus]ODA07148.1 [cytidine(C)-cytidine(C)-adenosine (A)]-adding enzyme [Paenibacillus polymyxa]OME72816.1 [cytidine(C)-cytidine(C)-adenosine (A)]-adding enzyme [Paenibacillus peoriae]
MNTNTWQYADQEMALHGREVIHTLTAAGHEAYWVGGCVRDELLGRAIHDMDLTTSAEPEQVIALFPHVIPTGIQHGTVTVMQGGHAFEVTTFRTESGYADHRRPTEVAFVKDIREDLMRRDFTMNAIAMAEYGERVDPFGGEADLRAALVRCVGRAEERFEEDGLRMLRCIRFASVFRFRVAFNTWKGMIRRREGLRYIAMERVRVELEKMLAGPDPLRGLEMLGRSGLLGCTKVPVPWEQCEAQALKGIVQLQEELRWGLLLMSCRLTSEVADELLRAWTFSNAVRLRLVHLLEWETELIYSTSVIAGDSVTEESDIINDEALRRSWIRLLIRLGKDTASDWLDLYNTLPASFRGLSPWVEKHVAKTAELASLWTKQAVVVRIKDLNITGNELVQEMNRPGGPWLGQMMEQLLQAVACGDIPNETETLLQEAKRVMSSE